MGKFENRKDNTAQTSWSRRRKKLWVTVAIELCILLALVIGLIAILAGNPLKGTWYDSDGLVYKFSPNSKGLLVLEDDLAQFRYQVKGHTLYIDFEGEEHEDCSYQFSIKDDKLYLDDGSGSSPWVYTRNK